MIFIILFGILSYNFASQTNKLSIMKNSKILSLLFLAFMLSQVTNAQERWSFELRPGVNFPISEILDEKLNTGFGAEVAFGYRFMEHLGVYAGWGWNQFVQKNDLLEESEDTDFEMTGYTFGLQFIHPINESSISYLVRGGGIYNHIEIENEAGEITYDSGHGLGWEAGVGVRLSLGETFKVTPQAGYRALNRDIDFGDFTEEVDLNYFSVSIGFTKLF
jgi:hypothetical protein